MKPAISLLAEGPLVTVRIRMKSEDIYVFPQMARSALERALPKGTRGIPSIPVLSMMNAAYAVLSIPFEPIACVEVEGEIWWMP